MIFIWYFVASFIFGVSLIVGNHIGYMRGYKDGRSDQESESAWIAYKRRRSK